MRCCSFIVTVVGLVGVVGATPMGTEGTKCTMTAFVPWTKCSESCDCGLQQRTRDIKDNGGDDNNCPHDAEARTCNCDSCEAVKKTKPTVKLPASSSHGFTPTVFKPAHGFPTDYGEQAACILDKAEAIVDLTPALVNCEKWDEPLGSPCYPESITHLIKHTEMCCEGREHFVLWKSDTFCEKRIAKLIQHLSQWAQPLFLKCVHHGDKDACATLKSQGTYNHFAKMLEEGIAAAKDLYAKGKPGDKTEAASAFLNVCVPEATSTSMWDSIKSTIAGTGGVTAGASCIKTVKSFVAKYDSSLSLAKEDTRRLRGEAR